MKPHVVMCQICIADFLCTLHIGKVFVVFVLRFLFFFIFKHKKVSNVLHPNRAQHTKDIGAQEGL